MTIRKFKLDYDWGALVSELDELFPLDTYLYHDEHPNPNGVYYYNIPESKFPVHIKEAIERSIHHKIKCKGWMWDWRCMTTELLIHTDTLRSSSSDWNVDIFENDPSVIGRPPITVNIAMENDFRLDVQNQKTKEWESVIYGPGDIVVFNNNTQSHGGNALNDLENIPRRSLNCYIDGDDLFDDEEYWNVSSINVPWPTITTKIEDGQKVPLQENYSFDDMAYLDSPEAYSIFETQADIIITKQCKGIVDVGCRHGPVLDILHSKGYTDFEYMGFDTSEEPIHIAIEKWKSHDNIEFRCESWNDMASFMVDFDVDQVMWSGVLLYMPNDHFKFFKKIVCDLYKSPNAIIQEPMTAQRHWAPGLLLNRISDDFDKYKSTFKQFKETKLDCEIFAGRRVIVDVTI